MNYSLAKELKDAGFPISGVHRLNREADACYPTLEELIEACGEQFHDLTRTNGVWLACTLTSTITHDTYGEGSTSEEAVARLWLALNKKP